MFIQMNYICYYIVYILVDKTRKLKFIPTEI